MVVEKAYPALRPFCRIETGADVVIL
jgi:hypothetical protein